MTTVFCTRELGVKPVPSLAARHKHKHSHTHNNPKLSRGSVRRSSCSRWRDQVLDKTSSARQRRRLVAQERTRHYASASPSDFEAATASTTDKGSAGVASTQEKEKIADVVRKMFISPLAFGVACIPLIVATAVAFALSKRIHVPRFVLQSIASVFVIVWLNLTNDVFDHETGVDVDKKESVVNRTGERDAIFWIANALLAVGVTTFIGVILQAKQGLAGAMLFASIGIGYLYQGPPFRLSYKGLGEILCFFAFGPLATTAFFLIQTGLRASDVLGQPLVMLSATLVGLTTSNILLNSHYHQIKTDKSSGKKSPAVRFGTKNVARATCVTVLLVYTIYITGLARGVVPTSTLLFTPLTVISALKLCLFVLKNHANEQVIKPAKFLAVQWHRNFAVLFSLGLLLCP